MALKFGYWMPLGSGGFVISNIKQRTDWSLDYNAKLAQTAEELGFEYGLAPARFLASHGWELQQEAITCTAVLAAQTKKAQAHQRGPHRLLASRDGREDACDHRCLFRRPSCDQRAHGLVQG